MAGPPIRTGHVPETVSLTGLVPTVLELAGFVPPKGPAIDGTSFADLATGARNANPDAGTAYAATLEDRHMSAMIRGRFKLIDNGIGLEMYDIHTDPHEHANLLPSHPPAEAALRKLMRAHNDAADRSPFD
jgi:arylsulfatase A-like enzyme